MVEKLHTPLPLHSASEAKDQHYQTVCTDIKNVLQGQAMTQACHALTSICTCAVHTCVPVLVLYLYLYSTVAHRRGGGGVYGLSNTHGCACCLCCTDEVDWVAAMSTVSSILHQAFDYFHWTVSLLTFLLTIRPSDLGSGLHCDRLFMHSSCNLSCKTSKSCSCQPGIRPGDDHIGVLTTPGQQ